MPKLFNKNDLMPGKMYHDSDWGVGGMFSCQCVGEEKFSKEKVGRTFFCYRKKVICFNSPRGHSKTGNNIAVEDVVVSL
jgi:hypothetical protein